MVQTFSCRASSVLEKCFVLFFKFPSCIKLDFNFKERDGETNLMKFSDAESDGT